MNLLSLISLAIKFGPQISQGISIATKLAPAVEDFVKAIAPVVKQHLADAPGWLDHADKVDHVATKLGNVPRRLWPMGNERLRNWPRQPAKVCRPAERK